MDPWIGDGGGRSLVESLGVVAVVDGSELGEDLELLVRIVGGMFGLEPRDSRRERPLVEDFTDATSDLSIEGAMTGAVFIGLLSLSLSLLDDILLRNDPRMDLDDPWVSDLEIGRVLPSGPSETAEEFVAFFEGAWPIFCCSS